MCLGCGNLSAEYRGRHVAVAGERRKKVVVAMTTSGLRWWELGLNHKRDSEAIRLLICEILGSNVSDEASVRRK